MPGEDSSSDSRRILVGVDRSLGARIALEHASRRAGRDGSLILAHVMSPVADALTHALSDLREARRAAGEELLDRLAADVGVAAEKKVVDGPPWKRLAELADETRADEIVVGTRGMGRFTAALGSVSHALLAQADLPVVVVPKAAADNPREPREHGECTVVVGYDGSPTAQAALRYAAPRAARGGRVIAVHTYHPEPVALPMPYYERASDIYREHGRELLQALEKAGDLGVEVETALVEGPSARGIVATADAHDADEIVIGSRGFGLVRSVLGSVSHAVLHETDRAVVVIPADATAAAQG